MGYEKSVPYFEAIDHTYAKILESTFASLPFLLFQTSHF